MFLIGYLTNRIALNFLVANWHRQFKFFSELNPRKREFDLNYCILSMVNSSGYVKTQTVLHWGSLPVRSVYVLPITERMLSTNSLI